MNRRQFIAAAGAGCAATIAGCTGNLLQAAENDDSDAAGDGECDCEGSAGERMTIDVGASGEVETEPDQAVANVGVRATGETAEAVNDELAERSETLRETLDDLGIPDENVESGRYDIRQRREGTQYEGTHAFQVTIEDVDRVGEVIDAAVEAGANDVGRVTFGLSDELRAEMRDAALDHALENADAEAAHIADNRGVEVVATRSVSARNVDVVPIRHEAAAETLADDADAAGTEFDTGPVGVTATVEVTYVAE